MRPFITIEKRAQEALDFYSSIFPSFSLISLNHHAEPHQELVMLAIFSIKGQEIMISDSFVSHDWRITPGISFFIDLVDEAIAAYTTVVVSSADVTLTANDGTTTSSISLDSSSLTRVTGKEVLLPNLLLEL